LNNNDENLCSGADYSYGELQRFIFSGGKMNTAIYLRLSNDDSANAESNSISNQRDLLSRYAAEHNYGICGEYVDDGYSGLTFKRPAFIRMIADIDAGNVDAVLVKDLSRLGRNNAMVSYYAEIFFPEHDVRLIAVNDGIDTGTGYNAMLQFKSVINEMYVRETAKKIKSAKRAMALRGERTGGPAPYGYMKRPDNKNKLIINPDTVETVRDCFRYAEQGFGLRKIGRYTHLPNTSIFHMLQNRTYVGDTVNRKYAVGRYRPTDEADRVIARGTHEAIIDEKTFLRVQEMMKPKPRAPRSVTPLFSGILICGSCGARYHSHGGNICHCGKCSVGQIQLKTVSKSILRQIESCIKSKHTLMIDIARLRRDESKLRANIKDAIESGDEDALRDCLFCRSETAKKISDAKSSLELAQRFESVSELTRETIFALIDRITIFEDGRIEIIFNAAV
jgi:DNA invertase Pin-like site-specific DNA recombinase